MAADTNVRESVVMGSRRSKHSDDVWVSTDLHDGPHLGGKRAEHQVARWFGSKVPILETLALNLPTQIVELLINLFES